MSWNNILVGLPTLIIACIWFLVSLRSQAREGAGYFYGFCGCMDRWLFYAIAGILQAVLAVVANPIFRIPLKFWFLLGVIYLVGMLGILRVIFYLYSRLMMSELQQTSIRSVEPLD